MKLTARGSGKEGGRRGKRTFGLWGVGAIRNHLRATTGLCGEMAASVATRRKMRTARSSFLQRGVLCCECVGRVGKSQSQRSGTPSSHSTPMKHPRKVLLSG